MACDRRGLGSVTQSPLPALYFPFLPSDLFGSDSVQPCPCKAAADEGSEKSLSTSQEHRKYPLKASSVRPCVNIPSAYICGCQQLSGPWMNELCAGPPFQAALYSVGTAVTALLPLPHSQKGVRLSCSLSIHDLCLQLLSKSWK